MTDRLNTPILTRASSTTTLKDQSSSIFNESKRRKRKHGDDVIMNGETTLNVIMSSDTPIKLHPQDIGKTCNSSERVVQETCLFDGDSTPVNTHHHDHTEMNTPLDTRKLHPQDIGENGDLNATVMTPSTAKNSITSFMNLNISSATLSSASSVKSSKKGVMKRYKNSVAGKMTRMTSLASVLNGGNASKTAVLQGAGAIGGCAAGSNSFFAKKVMQNRFLRSFSTAKLNNNGTNINENLLFTKSPIESPILEACEVSLDSSSKKKRGVGYGKRGEEEQEANLKSGRRGGSASKKFRTVSNLILESDSNSSYSNSSSIVIQAAGKSPSKSRINDELNKENIEQAEYPTEVVKHCSNDDVSLAGTKSSSGSVLERLMDKEITPYKHPQPTPNKERPVTRLWSTSNPTLALTLTPLQIKYQEAVYELICGEDDLVKDLCLLQSTYAQSLLNFKIFNSSEVNAVFNPIQCLTHLHMQLSQKLLQTANTKDQQNGYFCDVGETLLLWSETIKKSYIKYCSSLIQTKQFIDVKRENDKDFVNFLQRCLDSPFSRKMDLWSYLDSPRTRLVKYPLLFKQICKYSPSDCEIQFIRTAILQLESILSEVDKSMAWARCCQTVKRLDWIHNVDYYLIQNIDTQSSMELFAQNLSNTMGSESKPPIVLKSVSEASEEIMWGVLKNNRNTKLECHLLDSVFIMGRPSTRKATGNTSITNFIDSRFQKTPQTTGTGGSTLDQLSSVEQQSTVFDFHLETGQKRLQVYRIPIPLEYLSIQDLDEDESTMSSSCNLPSLLNHVQITSDQVHVQSPSTSSEVQVVTSSNSSISSTRSSFSNKSITTSTNSSINSSSSYGSHSSNHNYAKNAFKLTFHTTKRPLSSTHDSHTKSLESSSSSLSSSMSRRSSFKVGSNTTFGSCKSASFQGVTKPVAASSQNSTTDDCNNKAFTYTLIASDCHAKKQWVTSIKKAMENRSRIIEKLENGIKERSSCLDVSPESTMASSRVNFPPETPDKFTLEEILMKVDEKSSDEKIIKIKNLKNNGLPVRETVVVEQVVGGGAFNSLCRRFTRRNSNILSMEKHLNSSENSLMVGDIPPQSSDVNENIGSLRIFKKHKRLRDENHSSLSKLNHHVTGSSNETSKKMKNQKMGSVVKSKISKNQKKTALQKTMSSPNKQHKLLESVIQNMTNVYPTDGVKSDEVNTTSAVVATDEENQVTEVVKSKKCECLENELYRIVNQECCGTTSPNTSSTPVASKNSSTLATRMAKLRNLNQRYKSLQYLRQDVSSEDVFLDNFDKKRISDEISGKDSSNRGVLTRSRSQNFLNQHTYCSSSTPMISE